VIDIHDIPRFRPHGGGKTLLLFGCIRLTLGNYNVYVVYGLIICTLEGSLCLICIGNQLGLQDVELVW
jgi:hypothetical protein